MPLVIDIETKSECSIKESGAWAYSLHPSTEVLCMVGMDTETGETRRIDFRELDCEDVDWLNQYSILISHNNSFEEAIYDNILCTFGIEFRKIKWIDTMDIAAYMGAPLSLAGAAEFLLGDQEANQKDKEGRKLMLKICTPKNKKKMTWHEPTEEEFKGLMDYCEQDVVVSAELYKQYAHYVPEEEWKVMEETQVMNRQGIPVDLGLVENMMKFYQDACDALEVPEGYELTDVRSNKKMLAAIPSLENVQAETVQNMLDSMRIVPFAHQQLLEARQIMTMSSVKKLKKLVAWCGGIPSMKNGFQYHGAKTGRYAGRGPQPQNLPRGYDNDLDINIGRITVGSEI